METTYSCAKCGAKAVVRDDGTIVRSCQHEGEPVVANISATVYGKGSAQ